MNTNQFKMFFVTLLLLGHTVPVFAQIECEGTRNENIPSTTPSSDFTVHADGTVTHNKTGLMWMRCPQGKIWASTTCTGSANVLTWQQALNAAVSANSASSHGYTDWRLPNIKELSSIAEDSCSSPALNALLFPDATNDGYSRGYWSSSFRTDSTDVAWYLSEGDDISNSMHADNWVLLVRTAQ